MVLVGTGWANKGAETFETAAAGNVWVVVGVEVQVSKAVRAIPTPGRIVRS